MRISDWSSDVCSSDLISAIAKIEPGRRIHSSCFLPVHTRRNDPAILNRCNVRLRLIGGCARAAGDRKSVVQGKSVSVRVDLGGRRIIPKKRTTHTSQKKTTVDNMNI